MKSACLVVVSLLAFASVHVLAYDPSPLQDFCVALKDSDIKGGTHNYIRPHFLIHLFHSDTRYYDDFILSNI